jgi:PDZ domain-containing protein
MTEPADPAEPPQPAASEPPADRPPAAAAPAPPPGPLPPFAGLPAGAPPLPPPGRPPRRRAPVSRRRRIRNRILIASSLCMTAAIVILALLPTDYLAISPRAAEPVAPHVTISGGLGHYEPTGQLLYLTVSISSRTLRRVEWVQAKLDHDVTLIHESAYTQGRSRDEVRQQGQVEIADSKETAEIVAFRHLGLDPQEDGTGAVVQQVNDKFPVKDHLQPGDVVTAIDGQPVRIAQDIGTYVQPHSPGDVIQVTFERAKEPHTDAIPLSQTTDPDGGTRTVLGVTPVTRDLKLGLDGYTINIDTGSVGGPSAGLAFTLTLIDELTPGELTGGQVVAVTGTINPDGSVGPVGGAKQKAIAARRRHAVAMIVPAAEEAEARANADGMPVYSVQTVDDALAVLQRLGGTPPVVAGGDASAAPAASTTTSTAPTVTSGAPAPATGSTTSTT